MLLTSKQHSGAQTKSRSKLLEKLQYAVTANKGVPPERGELQPELPQCQLLATNIQALMVQEVVRFREFKQSIRSDKKN